MVIEKKKREEEVFINCFYELQLFLFGYILPLFPPFRMNRKWNRIQLEPRHQLFNSARDEFGWAWAFFSWVADIIIETNINKHMFKCNFK